MSPLSKLASSLLEDQNFRMHGHSLSSHIEQYRPTATGFRKELQCIFTYQPGALGKSKFNMPPCGSFKTIPNSVPVTFADIGITKERLLLYNIHIVKFLFELKYKGTNEAELKTNVGIDLSVRDNMVNRMFFEQLD